jgi:NADPH:quinone reductase-like Zn-dependent oxidoreductase
MKAARLKTVRLARHGKPGVPTIEDLPPPVPGPHEALVRIIAASINSRDVKNVQDLMAQTTLPRTPGRDCTSCPAAAGGGSVSGRGGRAQRPRRADARLSL